MGTHNRITKEKYYRIKKMLKVPADDKKVIAKGLCGKTTCGLIRNTKDYYEYVHETRKCHHHPKKKVVAPKKKQVELKPSDFELRETYEEARRSMKMLAMVLGTALIILIIGLLVAAVIVMGGLYE